MKHYGLIGFPLSHSFSEKYFAEKFSSEFIDADYKNFELHDLSGVRDVVAHYKLDGFNVTIPYKEKVLDFLDSIDPTAQQIGAVNCVQVRNGKLKGFNTDVIGFEKSLRPFIDSHPLKALIFGSGGGSLAVKYVLHQLSIPFLTVSRNETKDGITYADLNESLLNEYQLLINTTPVGMFPDINERLPLPYHFLNASHFAYDLIYNPERSSFLKACEYQGAQIKNGMEMLTIQADASYTIFTAE